MKERPILFNGEMVRAILEGRKTQTRRPVANVQRNNYVLIKKPTKRMMGIECHVCDLVNLDTRELGYNPPYGTVHDRLWVRETCKAIELPNGDDGLFYPADQSFQQIENTESAAEAWFALHTIYGKRGATVPSILAPRWASRITLEITAVRVERVQDISESDALAEGVGEFGEHVAGNDISTPQDAFEFLWNAAYPGSWERNDWVWVIEFKRVCPPVAADVLSEAAGRV